ncbi:MAG TPA: hypothetical protein VIG42_00300 [Solirubrobacteraceae bacterium]|jgi:hypothetical protein
MSTSFDPSLPSDVTLLLRADAEHGWLHREVIPVLLEVEAHGRLPDEQTGAALAYLEAMWREAAIRARETDTAHARLTPPGGGHNSLSASADRYHTVVTALRGILTERVRPFVEPPIEAERELAHEPLRIKDARGEARRPNAGGCTPRAA